MPEENIVLCPQWLCSKPSKVKIVESKPSFPSHGNIINWCENERETKTTLKINLEQQLLKIGNRLFQPPSSISELLWLLTKTDHLLCKVNQDPCASMQAALSPIMKALIAKEFLKHSDCDVRVAVASCLSELTRITAPDFPYNEYFRGLYHFLKIYLIHLVHLTVKGSKSSTYLQASGHV